MTKKILTGVLMILALALVGTSQTKSHVHKVVFENNSGPDAWPQLMGNIENIRTAFAPDEVQIEVVNLGKGLAFVQKTNGASEARIKKMVDAGVIFDACQNSMKLRHVTTEDLFPFAAQVDSGVAQVVRKQEAGFSYVKGGE